jgi:hypothetical protein
MTKKKLCHLITKLYTKNSFLLDTVKLKDADRNYYKSVSETMDESTASMALYNMCDYLSRYYEKKAIVLIDDMNRVSESIFSSFDTGRNPSRVEPERFYHGFVLGLMVDLQGRYIITSNRESGFGRYDIMLEPQNDNDPAIIIEFKVINKSRENSLEETVQAALTQIKEKDYARQLTERGFAPERIHSYGFAFQGKEVLIGE